MIPIPTDKFLVYGISVSNDLANAHVVKLCEMLESLFLKL